MLKISQGIDIVKVARIRQSIQQQGKAFLRRVFTPLEQEYCHPRKRKFEHYAARFAAKEAVMKALAVAPPRTCGFHEIEILHHASGKPYVRLRPEAVKRMKLPKGYQLEVSLTHDMDFAAATALLILR